jgi:hypothetical protein
MQNLGTGRLDLPTEQAIMKHLRVGDLSEAYGKLRKASAQTLARVQKIIGPRRGNGARVENPQDWQLIAGGWQEKRWQ